MSTDPKTPARIWHQSPWRWLFSLRVGVVLLTVITVASIWGTLIEELPEAQRVVYYSWWYRALLLALAINVGCATYRTIAEKILPARKIRYHAAREFYDAMRPNASMPFRGSMDDVKQELERRGYRVYAEGDAVYARKGRLGRWGAPIAHVGMIIILFGGFISAWTAREGIVALYEGQATDEMIIQGDPRRMEPLGFVIRCDDFDTDFFPRTRIPSHFVSMVTVMDANHEPRTEPVEVNRSMHVAGWTLHQSSYEEAPRHPRYRVAIGHEDLPSTMTMEISPDQTREIPEIPGMYLKLGDSSAGAWELLEGDTTLARGRLHGARPSTRIRAEQFVADFVIGQDRRVTSRSEQMNNPALQVGIYEGDRLVDARWLFARDDLKAMMHTGGGEYDLELMSIAGQPPDLMFHIDARMGDASRHIDVGLHEFATLREAIDETPAEAGSSDSAWRVRLAEPVMGYRTILTLTRNAAIPIAYLGCAITMLGLFVSFFIQRRDVWAWFDRGQGMLRIGALYRHPQPEFDRATAHAIDRLNRKALEDAES